jgi:hypothetical protein
LGEKRGNTWVRVGERVRIILRVIWTLQMVSGAARWGGGVSGPHRGRNFSNARFLNRLRPAGFLSKAALENMIQRFWPRSSGRSHNMIQRSCKVSISQSIRLKVSAPWKLWFKVFDVDETKAMTVDLGNSKPLWLLSECASKCPKAGKVLKFPVR